MFDSINAKWLILVIAVCIPFFLYDSRSTETFSITEGTRVKLSDRAFPCKTKESLSKALDHFMRGEIGEYRKLIDSGECFDAAKADHSIRWTVAKYSDRKWSVSDGAETYWTIQEWLKVD